MCIYLIYIYIYSVVYNRSELNTFNIISFFDLTTLPIKVRRICVTEFHHPARSYVVDDNGRVFFEALLL